MTDYDSYDLAGQSDIVNIDDTKYLVQGRVDDEITMFRPINELLECEKDTIQTAILGDRE